MAEAITAEALRGSPTRLLFHAHIDGGSLWSHQSTVEPRITTSILNVDRRGVRTQTRKIYVDGVPVADLEEAVARLNAGPAPEKAADDGSAAR